MTGLARLAGMACLLMLSAGSAWGFHDGGVANCNGCHILHNSQDGLSQVPIVGEMLLQGESSTDLCLSCHAEEFGAVLGNDPQNPPPQLGAGNFVFLREENINDGPDGATNPIGGHQAGHNIISFQWSLDQDPEHEYSPGGNYPSTNMSCTSCHDPHGNTNFRLLRGVGTDATGFTFINSAPLAQGVDLQGGPEGQTNHTAYQGGWSDWCANCHGYFHEQDGQIFEHPVDDHLSGDEAHNYNRYNAPQSLFIGTYDTAYIPEVPIEDPNRGVGDTFGAVPQSRINCMTCHRAHGSSAPRGTRWDGNVEFISEDGGVSGSYSLPSQYMHPDQRALCVKCHFRDAEDHGFDQPCLDCHRQGD